MSDLGRVRSLDRTLRDGRLAGGVVLTPSRSGEGYLTVTLRDGKRSRTAAVHVLVLEAFEGPAPDGKPQGRHLNGDQLDCSRGNLAWGSQADNERDKKRTKGKRRRGNGRGNRGINIDKGSIGFRVQTVVDLGIPRSGGCRP